MPDRFRLDIGWGYLAPVEFFQVGNGVFKVGFFMVDPVHYKHNRLVERLDLAELIDCSHLHSTGRVDQHYGQVGYPKCRGNIP